MKQIFTIAAIAVLTLSTLTLNAQNKFKGIIKYSITSTGTTPIEIPAEKSTDEIRVMGDKILQGTSAIQDGLTTFTIIDLSQLLGYLNSNDITLTSYNGDGKIYIKHTYTQNEIDSLTIPVTEGYYIEYVNGETKKVANYDAQLARIHSFGEDGGENIINIWYTSELGPAYNFVQMMGIKGIPLEYTSELGDGKAITLTATEITSGKVKSAEFLLPAGYNEIPIETFQKMQTEIQEELELLQE